MSSKHIYYDYKYIWSKYYGLSITMTSVMEIVDLMMKKKGVGYDLQRRKKRSRKRRLKELMCNSSRTDK
jgi:hypothetical protein